MNKQICCSVNGNDYNSFQKFYPQCLSKFVRNSIHMALQDKKFFDLVFFNDVKEIK